MEQFVGILYDNGDVSLTGRKKLTKDQTFEIIKNFANLVKDILLKLDKENEEIAKSTKNIFSDAFETAYLSIMAGSDDYKELLKSFYHGISDKRFAFEIKPEEDWKVYLVITPSSVRSLLNTILYCMIMMSTEFSGDIYYVLKGVEISKEFNYKENN